MNLQEELNQELRIAINSLNYRKIKKLIRKGADLSSYNLKGQNMMITFLNQRPRYRDNQQSPISEYYQLLNELAKQGLDIHQTNSVEGKPISFGFKVSFMDSLMVPGRPLRPENLLYRDSLAEDLKELVEDGVDINSSNAEHESFLMVATLNQDIYAMEYLIEAGADLDIKDSQGRTALMMATSSSDNLYPFYLLVKAGADLNKLDHLNQTVLDYLIEEEMSLLAFEQFEAAQKYTFLINMVRSSGAKRGKELN